MPFPDAVEDRIKAAIVRALGPAAAQGSPLAMGETPGWDSMGHMTIVLELEREFGIRFPAYRLPELVDVASVARVLREARTA
jgi:acyl carrier protein